MYYVEGSRGGDEVDLCHFLDPMPGLGTLALGRLRRLSTDPRLPNYTLFLIKSGSRFDLVSESEPMLLWPTPSDRAVAKLSGFRRCCSQALTAPWWFSAAWCLGSIYLAAKNHTKLDLPSKVCKLSHSFY